MSKAKSQVRTQELVKGKLYLIIQRTKMFTTMLEAALIKEGLLTILEVTLIKKYTYLQQYCFDQW